MPSGGARITGQTYVLAVPDIARTGAWWRDVMGFESWLTPPGWWFLRRGPCVVRLGECPDAIPPKDLGDHQYFAYIEVDDVDAYFAEISHGKPDILFPPRNQAWGMREFGVRTPDGHRVMFATALKS